jgi:hypothetical protein
LGGKDNEARQTATKTKGENFRGCWKICQHPFQDCEGGTDAKEKAETDKTFFATKEHERTQRKDGGF